MKLLETLDLGKAKRIEITYPTDVGFEVVVIKRDDYEYIMADGDALYVWHRDASNQRRLWVYNLKLAKRIYIVFEGGKGSEG